MTSAAASPRRRRVARGRGKLAAPLRQSVPTLGAPAWVEDLLGDADYRLRPQRGAAECVVSASDEHTLVSVRVASAADLAPADFERATADAYAAIAAELKTSPAGHPVRFWNYIPGIHLPCGAGLDRYMVFNAGRFAACSDWFGGPQTFDRMLATASGVGHHGSDLVIHALAARAAGVAVENPRQVPPYLYSRRFGPRPPCFARATVLAAAAASQADRERRLILVGGTASIRGEESVYVGDLAAQTRETFVNLDALVRHAADVAGAGRADLSSFRDLRVYHTRAADRFALAGVVAAAFPGLRRVEYMQADLCRPELLVEIEGVAESRAQ